MFGLIDRVAEALFASHWLFGESFGPADTAVTPHFLRLDHVARMPPIEVRPRVAEWYARVLEPLACEIPAEPDFSGSSNKACK